MRRSEREVTDCNEIRQILERAEVLRLAMHDEPYPYIVPVNFGFTMQDDQLVLFFHSIFCSEAWWNAHCQKRRRKTDSENFRMVFHMESSLKN